jgi:uncharacterized protein (DUF433 family)
MDSNPTVDTTVPVISEHIVTTPGVCGGKPRIAGHRITVQNIVIWHERGGLTPDEIVAEHPGVTLADVHAALAYFWDHAEEIRAQIRAGEEFAEQLRGQSPSLVEEKLRQRSASGDSVSS